MQVSCEGIGQRREHAAAVPVPEEIAGAADAGEDAGAGVSTRLETDGKSSE
jgi:hypothetical protein